MSKSLAIRILQLTNIYLNLRRLAKLCSLSGSSKIKNLALVPDPAAYASAKFIKFNDHAARFYLVGTCAYSQLKGDGGRNHQICVVPFASTWERSVAVVARIFGKGCVFLSSYKGWRLLLVRMEIERKRYGLLTDIHSYNHFLYDLQMRSRRNPTLPPSVPT